MNRDRVEHLIRELLVEIGEDPGREGLVHTPKRVAIALDYLTWGYRANRESIINNAIFTQTSPNMVVARDIELYSLCEHHLMPILGRCHIGYVSNGKIFGLSKLARLMEMHARRLQIQERLTEQIALSIMDSIAPKGVGVIIEARHLCMMMRGIEKQNSLITTSSVLGSFRTSKRTRDEFLALVNHRS